VFFAYLSIYFVCLWSLCRNRLPTIIIVFFSDVTTAQWLSFGTLTDIFLLTFLLQFDITLSVAAAGARDQFCLFEMRRQPTSATEPPPSQFSPSLFQSPDHATTSVPMRLRSGYCSEVGWHQLVFCLLGSQFTQRLRICQLTLFILLIFLARYWQVADSVYSR